MLWLDRKWLMVAALACAACGASQPPVQRLRYADVGRGAAQLDWRRPILLELQPGDRIPIRLSFSDQAFELSPSAPPLELVARRRCFVLVSDGGIKTSLTGRDFDQKPLSPGQFRFGLSLTREGAWIEAAVTTPQRMTPESARAPSPAPERAPSSNPAPARSAP